MASAEVQPVMLPVPKDKTLPEVIAGLCTAEYPNHRHGCPNFGTKRTCPPTAALLPDVLHVDKPIFAVWNVYDFAGHVARMKEKHPNWTKRQLECCLYWQPTARKALGKHLMSFLADPEFWRVVACPEACGVDVTATLAQVGVNLEWPPVTVTYQVALVGQYQEKP